MVRTESRPEAERDEAPALPRPPRPERLRKVKRVFVGEPLETERLKHERLNKTTALAVFASDNLSSSAYATEEILRVLVPIVAVAAFGLVVPITLALLAVLAILLFSYRQTIKAYPQAGGAYLVTRDNFGVFPAQFAGVALLTDYILTVSVSVSAGTAALVSAFPGLFDWRVTISVGFIALIAWGNLRGVRESGRMFAVPTYFFIAMMAVLLAVALWRVLTGSLHPVETFPLPSRELTGAGLFLVLHAFASGGAAVTGVEAISNGVPAFRPPEWKNARSTLMWMGGLLGTMFLGLSLLAWRLHTVPDPGEKVTVIAQIGKAVFGTSGVGSGLFVALQAATMFILVLAANTSFADFPRLASFHAHDHFLPRQLTRFGDRLVFSNGIIVLAGLASILVIAFEASVTRLIPLYAIGVFTSFTFSQAGMAVRHRRLREGGWRKGIAINGTGAVVSALMTVIIAATKFADGAWLILLAAPLMLFGLLRVNRHYEEAESILKDPQRRPPQDIPRQRVIVPVGHADPVDRYALAYAQRVFPTHVTAVHFSADGASDEWFLEENVAGESRELRRGTGDLTADLCAYVRKVHGEVVPGELLNVVIPETVTTVSSLDLGYILRRGRLQRLKAALVAQPDVVVTNVTHHLGFEALEPAEDVAEAGESENGWRHVAVLLVAGVGNATLTGLRYARSLGPDELHCLHIGIDEDDTETVVEDWRAAVAGVPLKVLESPYRQVTRPIFDFVREVLGRDTRTFVTIIVPHIIVRRRWHNLLHNQTALMLKAAFLFEPSVVVSAVPYRLDVNGSKPPGGTGKGRADEG